MATTSFSVAPSVQWTERDATLQTSPSVVVQGATAGKFQWGEVELPVLVTGGETGLVKKFFKPNDDTAIDFLVVADFMSYSSVAWVTRIVGPTAKNAVTSGQPAVLIKNKLDFETASPSASITWTGRYPGSLGNDVAINVCDSATFPTWEFRNNFAYAPQAGEFHVVVVDKVGRITDSTGAVGQVDRISVSGTATAAGSITVAGEAIAYTDTDTPATLAAKIGLEMEGLTNVYSSVVVKSNTVILTHKAIGPQPVTAIVPDANGLTATAIITTVGASGAIIEKYELMQNTQGAKKSDGANAYFKDVINNTSNWVYTFTDALVAGVVELAGGVDDYDVNRVAAIEALNNAEAYDAKPVFAYCEELIEQQAIIDLSTERKDTVSFVSPLRDVVVGNRGREMDDVVAWRESLVRDSSYFFMDDNWAYVYDKYNDKMRWIPACGGTAGLWARTIEIAGIYKSPAFHNRGKYNNYNRMAWSASSDERAVLYRNQINSIVTFSTEGIVLYGDKTGLTRPSAFDRINVRGLFIMAEQNIAAIAKYYLGENNDAFTRSLFSNAVRPYIRQLANMGAIYDGKVKCDEDNNPAEVIAANQMVAGIWLKPEYSINWVYLDFAAVRPDMEFSEIESGGGIVAAS
ncbi:tail sheath protein [Serratia phage vB_Sru_IME250]|uniref:Tail sheath protein n=1 Tax=Serratia phage vB_Sru_IME250 TaxID=1852640 RepID=A0A1J0MG69_9CAUD|nr:tail sheath protein [Serratia phage vB_Sru_IME250]ANM47224.1 tail sheath protein [Serratia phage vB_Sru_IME250]APD20132.1 tail sheath protein [Serratia phage vB_Sru_IME250]